jgi:hypothetical protein
MIAKPVTTTRCQEITALLSLLVIVQSLEQKEMTCPQCCDITD